MSQLAILADEHVGEEPRILSFCDHLESRGLRGRMLPDERARREYRNRCCTICRRATVESIELRNGLLGRNGKMIPGTGTLVGFSCNACGHEWPA